MVLRVPELPRAPRSAVERCLVQLERALGPSVVDTSEQGREAARCDDSDADVPAPDAVVRARSSADIAETLAIAEASGVPVTPRAGGTGRTGGAVPLAGGIVLDTSRLAAIKDIDRTDRVAVVEPGVITGDLHAACEAEGLFYPPDPNSLATCCVGGNVAENAGGPRAFKYGSTREYVLGLEACLMGGRVLRVGRRTKKGVTGYDVTGLLVGSEGTLAVFSEVTVRLVAKPAEVATVLAVYRTLDGALDAADRVAQSGVVPQCLELVDGLTLDALRAQGVVVDPAARALLLMDVEGTPSVSHGELERLGDALSAPPSVIEVQAAQDPAARARLWEARRMLSKATRRLARFKLSEDVVVPVSKLGALLGRVDDIGARTGVRHLAYGHAGDGNMHVNFLWNEEGEREAVDRAIGELMRATVDLGGTLSGEHGIGVAKAPYLPLEQSEPLIALQRDLKRVFDPQGLLNPGKVFPVAGHKAC